MSYAKTVLALAVALPLAACGPELLGGAQRGEVRTVATSEEEGASSTMAPSPSRAAVPAAWYDEAIVGSLVGEVTLNAAAWLVSADGDEIPLTDGTVVGSFRIEGPDEAPLGRVDVGEGHYTAVRMVFTRVVAVVEGGLLVDGTPVIGPVRVDLGAARRAVVERPVELVVEPRTTRTVVVDLDVHEWLPATVLPGPLVPGHVFAAAVDVRVR